jgi:hypothetical protein
MLNLEIANNQIQVANPVVSFELRENYCKLSSELDNEF